MADVELQDAINKAAVEITKDLPDDHKSKVTEVTEVADESKDDGEAESTDEPVVDDPASSDLTKEELEEAQRLYRALKDPKAGPALVAALAQQNGLLNRPIETKTEVKETKKDILSIFKEELGESYGFLAERLGKAVDKALDQVRAEQQEQVAALQVHNLTTEVNATLAKLAKETSGESRKLENRMAELMDEYPIGKSGNVEKYIRDMYVMASSGKAKANIEKSTADRIRRNANNVTDRLNRAGSEPSLDTLPGGKPMSLKESVNWAVGQLNKGKK